MFRNSSGIRVLIGAGLFIILVISLIVLIIVNLNQHRITNTVDMASYASNPSAQVAMLIDGPINAAQKHNQVLVVANNYQTTIKVFKGYNDDTIFQKSFPATVSSFHVFLRALEYASYTNGSNNPNLRQASGYCPTENRYIFTFSVNGKQRTRYWTTDCSNDPSTFKGNLPLTLQLFAAQVPGFNNIVSNLNINQSQI